MRRFLIRTRDTKTYRFIVGAVLLGMVVAGAPLLSRGQPATTAITIANDSGLTIRHVYLSPVTQNSWSSDQLNDSPLGPGGSVTINTSCGGSIKVIAEDQDGCFLSVVVTCSNAVTWTITATSARDCG